MATNTQARRKCSPSPLNGERAGVRGESNQSALKFNTPFAFNVERWTLNVELFSAHGGARSPQRAAAEASALPIAKQHSITTTSGQIFFPLPKGEGQGEGEEHIHQPIDTAISNASNLPPLNVGSWTLSVGRFFHPIGHCSFLRHEPRADRSGSDFVIRHFPSCAFCAFLWPSP